MKASFLFLVLGTTGSLLAGEVQWGDASNFKSPEDKVYPTFDFATKEITPDSLSKGTHSGVFDKLFTTQNATAFDKEFSFGGKEYKANNLSFDKIYGTKDLDYTSKFSPLGQQTNKLKLSDHPWSSHAAVGFDKQIPLKEDTGPEAKAVGQDMTSIFRKLNSLKDIPDRDLNVDEVRDLVNNGHIPSVMASVVKPPDQPTSPQASPPAPSSPTPQ